ncbi:MAG: hypothetical protein IPF52_07120 [Saprospiraceae bacterium]|nr:hypothetical protein [Saprospiraceae bacterium]
MPLSQEVPNWASTTGSNPITNFLQYNTAISTQIEQGGLLGTGISTDFAVTTRCPGGGCPGAAATPDRGAWELNGTPLDLTGPSITYTDLSNAGAGPTSRTTTSLLRSQMQAALIRQQVPIHGFTIKNQQTPMCSMTILPAQQAGSLRKQVLALPLLTLLLTTPC